MEMNRRHFTGLIASAAIAQRLPRALAAEPSAPLKPFALGVVINPFSAPEERLRTVHELGFTNCFLSMDKYIGSFTPSLASQYRDLLAKYQLTATTVEVVGPGTLQWNVRQGPSTIGLVPPETRAARIDALSQASNFAKQVGISQVQTHCGFIPENPGDPLYQQAVEAIRTVAKNCQDNGQSFLMETGQETPITMLRAIQDVNMPNLGVGFDTANLVAYGNGNPVDAIDILGPHVMSVHAKDGLWPTDPYRFGKEVLIGTGVVDFKQVFTKLHRLGYKGAISIEHENAGAKQMEDIRQEKIYLERVIREVMA
jgi:L-ribulose-5-phosphate 3-epimerase